MPALLTHDFFGRTTWPQVSAQQGLGSDAERDAFLLGNQGPDPLFFLRFTPWKGKRYRLASLLHGARPAHLLAAFHDALDMLSPADRGVGQAYVAGFCCHYLLDRKVHPFVYFMEHGFCDAGVEGLTRDNANEVHIEIERDLDEMVLFSKTGQTIATYRPFEKALHGSDEVLAIIDKLYFYACLWTYSITVDASLYTKSIKSYRRMQRVAWSPKGGSQRVLGTLERLVGRKTYSLYCAASHRDRAEDTSVFANDEHLPWSDPSTDAVSTESFWDLYEAALGEVPDVEQVLSKRSFDLKDALALTRGINFEGAPVGEDDPFEILES